MKEKILQFIQWDEFYRHYQPLTPYGFADKQLCRIYTAPAELAEIYRLTELGREYIINEGDRAARAEYHLKRIPELNSLSRITFDQTDLFLIKKFLLNFQAAVHLFNSDLKAATGCRFVLSDLLKELSADGSSDETFYLSEKYSSELAASRARIREFDARLKEMRRNRLQLIKDELKIDLRFQDFSVLPESEAVHLNRDLVYLESYDSTQVVVKPVFTEEYHNLHFEREEEVRREKTAEQQVLARLTASVKAAREELESSISAVKTADLALSRARLSLKLNCSRPKLQPECAGIKITAGRLIPLLEKCAKDQLVYQPLTLELDKRLLLLNGSNMGGKTILLKTVLFLQTVAQTGLFVPAESFCSTVFKNLVFVGENNSGLAGLSSFGLEICNFMEGYTNPSQKTLFIIDEFARTTNSREALALLKAVMQVFDENQNIHAFFSTHFMEVPEYDNLAFYRMKGLDRAAFAAIYRKEKELTLLERIRLINGCMQYAAEKDDRTNPPYDALLIAEILGLEERIVEWARKMV